MTKMLELRNISGFRFMKSSILILFLFVNIGFVQAGRPGTWMGENKPAKVEHSSSRKGSVQVGMASFYGREFDGGPTSSGEIYHCSHLTAAHRTLPFNTIVRVTNLSNGKKVIVRINDRGPFVKGRIIDLSLAAAKRLDMIEAGVVKVKLEVIR
jgi:rare lipoprotein A (peptidoglycan hydrolase)